MSSILHFFGDSGNIAVASLAVSVIAVALSIFSYRKSTAVQRRQLEIEEERERDRVLEKKKASLVGRIVREPPAPTSRSTVPSFFLELENKGKVQATDLTVLLDGKPVLEHAAIIEKRNEIKQIGPESNVRYRLSATMSTPLPRAIRMAWSDESPEAGSYESTLT